MPDHAARVAGAVISSVHWSDDLDTAVVTRRRRRPYAEVVDWAMLLGVLAIAWWETRPLQADADYARGLRLASAGQASSAAVAYQAAIGTWSAEPTYWNELARADFAIARSQASPPGQHSAYVAAEQAGQHAVYLAPAFLLFWSNLGLWLGADAELTHDAGLAAEARAMHRRAVTLADYWVYWRDAGVTELRLSDPRAAEQDFERSLDANTWLLLRDAARASGDQQTAARDQAHYDGN